MAYKVLLVVDDFDMLRRQPLGGFSNECEHKRLFDLTDTTKRGRRTLWNSRQNGAEEPCGIPDTPSTST
jgi:hypothetical protein